MKKLGILTFHYPVNEGAMLQSYCIIKHLKKNLPGWIIELVNYVDSKNPDKIYNLSNPREKALKFFSENLPLSKEKFSNMDNIEEYLNKNYNALVFGSDEIWRICSDCPIPFNPLLSFIYQKTNSFFPQFPNPYWPSTKLRIPKISYAPCVGITNKVNIPKKYLKIIKKRLLGIELISVRNKNTKDFLNFVSKEIGKRTEIVPDPTFSQNFLLEVNKEELKEKLEKYGVDFSSKVVLVLCENSSEINKLITKFKARGYQAVGMSIKNTFVDVNLSDKNINPLEWANIFGFADFVITSRMHGCICSILNKTPFIAIDTYANKVNKHSKIGDLLDLFNLEKLHYRQKIDNEEKLFQIYEKISCRKLPIKKINQELKQLKKQSKDFAIKIRRTLENV